MNRRKKEVIHWRYVPILAGLEVLALMWLVLNKTFPHLPPLIPVWQSRFYVADRLAPPSLLWWVAGILSTLMVLWMITAMIARVRFPQYRSTVVGIFSIAFFLNMVGVGLLLMRCLKTSTLPLTIPPYSLTLLSTGLLAFLLATAISPLCIRFSKRAGLLDDPERRKGTHPAILHTTTTPRGGALPLVLALITVGWFFLPHTIQFLGIYAGALIALITGLIDDRYEVNPYVRLIICLPLAILCVIGTGTFVQTLTNPFGGVFELTPLVGKGLSFLWIMWVMNMLNWSNGVDGQFPSIAAVAALVISLLSLRFIPYEPEQLMVALLGMIVVGATLGTLPWNWHPARMFYGFGNTAVGLILATLAIMTGAKVATAVLVLIVPTSDAIFTLLRRVKNKRSPVWGDKEHLHHRLLALGWTQAQVSVFYLSTSLFFGFFALVSSGKLKALSMLSGIGFVAFTLVMVHLMLEKQRKQESLT